MANRTVSVTLALKGADFARGMAQAAKSAGEFDKSMQSAIQKNQEHLDTLANGMGIVGAGMVAAAGIAVKSFADFDKAMSGVEAATHETAENMNLLREAALEAGKRTAFSATEAADAITELAKAGVSTADILSGGLNAALDLAAAAGIEAGEAAEYISSALTQFGLKGKDASHVADLLAAGAGKAQGEVSDMGYALAQSGLVASQAGLSIEETTGFIAAMASAGMMGSDAGTSFKTMLLSLINPSKEASETMHALGIAAWDAQGNFVGMEHFSGQLQAALGDLSVQQRNAALATIFGSDAVKAANVAFAEGAPGIGNWIDAVNETGYAAQTAAIQMDNLAGDWEQLMGAIETALIETGEGADSALRNIVQAASGMVDAFTEIPGEIQNVLLWLVGSGGLAVLGAAGILKLVTAISNARAAFMALGTAARVASISMGAIGIAIGAAAWAFAAWAESNAEAKAESESFQDTLDQETGKITSNTKAWVINKLERSGANEAAKTLGIGLGTLRQAYLGEEKALAKVQKKLAETTDVRVSNNTYAEEGVGITEEENAATQLLNEQLGAQLKRLQASKQAVKNKNEADKEAKEITHENVSAIEELQEKRKADAEAAAQQELAIGHLNTVLEEMENRAEGLNLALKILNSTMGNVEAESAYEQAIDDATDRLKEYRKEVKDGDDATRGMKNALDLGTQAGRDNAASLRTLWERASAYATETLKVEGNQKKANAILRNGRAELVDMATKFLGSRAAAEKYIEEVLGIPKDVETEVSTPGADASKKKLNNVDAAARKIPARKAVNIVANTAAFWSAYSSVLSAVNSVAAMAASIPFADGGLVGVRKFADGGFNGPVSGPGGPRDDRIPAMLSDGEYVVKASSVEKYGLAFMDALNSGHLPMSAKDDARYSPTRGIAGPEFGGVGGWTKGRGDTFNFNFRQTDLTEQSLSAATTAARLRQRVGRP